MSKYNLLMTLIIAFHAGSAYSVTIPAKHLDDIPAYRASHADWLIQDWRTTVQKSTITVATKSAAQFQLPELLVAQNNNNTGYPRTYLTYTKTNPVTNKVYSGRTSGFGNAGDILKNMDTTHHMNDQGFGPAQIDRYSNNKYVIRSREKQLIRANQDANKHAKSTDSGLR